MMEFHERQYALAYISDLQFGRTYVSEYKKDSIPNIECSPAYIPTHIKYLSKSYLSAVDLFLEAEIFNHFVKCNQSAVPHLSLGNMSLFFRDRTWSAGKSSMPRIRSTPVISLTSKTLSFSDCAAEVSRTHCTFSSS